MVQELSQLEAWMVSYGGVCVDRNILRCAAQKKSFYMLLGRQWSISSTECSRLILLSYVLINLQCNGLIVCFIAGQNHGERGFVVNGGFRWASLSDGGFKSMSQRQNLTQTRVF